MQVRNSWRVGAVTAGLLTIVLATALASPAMAYVVEVTTSIDLTDVADKAQLRQAVESAVEDVLANAISFRQPASRCRTPESWATACTSCC